MLPPKMIQSVCQVLNEAGVPDAALANLTALQSERLQKLVEAITSLLPEDRRLHPVEVLTEKQGIGYSNIEALRKAGFYTLGDLIDRVGWRYTRPPEFSDIPTWGTTTIGHLRDYLNSHGLLSSL